MYKGSAEVVVLAAEGEVPAVLALGLFTVFGIRVLQHMRLFESLIDYQLLGLVFLYLYFTWAGCLSARNVILRDCIGNF